MADKKRLFQPQFKEKWLFGMEPLEPIPLGPHCKRWYKTKDKLPSKYLAKHRNRLLKCPVDSRRWISVRNGLDYFGTGRPPADNMIIRGPREGFLPTTDHRAPRPPPRKTQKKLSEGELLSKLSPAQEAQKAFVEEIDASLTQHPLAPYPDLKESLPSDLLLMMQEEIDTDKKVEDEWAYCEGMKDRKKSPTKPCEKHPEEVNPEPSEPSQPGTSWPTQPGTSQPSQPGTSQPSHPGTSWPTQPGTSQTTQPGTSGPSQPGPPNLVNLKPPSHVNLDLLNKSTRDLLANSTRDLLNKPTRDLLANSTGDLLANLTRDPPSKSTKDLPAKLTWEQLVKSSWDLLAKSTMNPRPSQLVPPGQVHQGPPKQVNRRPPKQVNQGPPKKVNREPPKEVNWGPPGQVKKGPPGQVKKGPPGQVKKGPPGQVKNGPPDQVKNGPPDQVKKGPPGQVKNGPPDQLNQGSLGKVTPGASDQVNQRPPKDSFLSYLMKLFPEEKKKKKSSRKGIPKTPDPYRYVGDEDSEFYRWTDAFGDMDIDEKFITEQFEIDDKCTPNHNMGNINKTQIPAELYYSKELDDIKEIEFDLQEGNWERKLRKPTYPYGPKWGNVRYGEWYLNPKTSKKQIKDEPWVGPKVLKEQEYQSQARDLEPDILDGLYGPIAFKDFIVSKGYRMPGVIEKLFLRKKWTYDSVKSPVDRVLKLLPKVPDDTSEDD